MENKLIVLFPGINYSCDCPFLYYGGFKYEVKDYKKKCITYNLKDDEKPSYEKYIESIKKDVLSQLEHVDFSAYTDIVFLSKSIGTVIACWAQDKLDLKVKHIFLTPIDKTLPYIKKSRNISWVISGTKDKKVDLQKLKSICKDESVKTHIINGVGHRLEKFDDMKNNINILKEVIEII